MPGARASTWWRSRTPPTTHNMVVCTLCSCYPWPVLGLPPVWYKSAPYRSRAVLDPRGVLRRLRRGAARADTEIRVWDSTAEIRYLVIPMRPAGTDGWSEERLAELVTRDSMIGTGLPGSRRRMNGAHDMGGDAWASARCSRSRTSRCFTPSGSGAPLRSRWRWEPAAGTSTCRGFAREDRPPDDYLSTSYYEIWLAGLERLLPSAD